MPVVDYRFRTCDEATNPSTEWLRQVGVAIATAAWVMADDAVELWTGTVSDAHHVQVELLTFRVARREELLAAALRSAGASRLLSVRVSDGAPDPRLVPFGLLYAGTLVRPFWHGPANEADLRSFTGLNALCTRDDAEDDRLLGLFGAPDLAARLAEFVGPARRAAPSAPTSLARSTCRRP